MLPSINSISDNILRSFGSEIFNNNLDASHYLYTIRQEMSSTRAGEHDKLLYELSQRRYSVCLLPFRAEPRGYLGLKSQSCGIPCIVPTHAAVAPIISRLCTEPEYFIGPYKHTRICEIPTVEKTYPLSVKMHIS